MVLSGRSSPEALGLVVLTAPKLLANRPSLNLLGVTVVRHGHRQGTPPANVLAAEGLKGRLGRGILGLKGRAPCLHPKVRRSLKCI